MLFLPRITAPQHAASKMRLTPNLLPAIFGPVKGKILSLSLAFCYDSLIQYRNMNKQYHILYLQSPLTLSELKQLVFTEIHRHRIFKSLFLNYLFCPISLLAEKFSPQNALEALLKILLGLKSFVGTKCSILKIL